MEATRRLRKVLEDSRDCCVSVTASQSSKNSTTTLSCSSFIRELKCNKRSNFKQNEVEFDIENLRVHFSVFNNYDITLAKVQWKYHQWKGLFQIYQDDKI